jgi:tRNA (cmo5U34)-methyltransferase
MTVMDFSFAEHAPDFDQHIQRSIPSYDRLGWWIETLSRRFVQPSTRVVDIGCSTGAMLARVCGVNQGSRHNVEYLGIDIAGGFERHWSHRQAEALRFEMCDAISFDRFENLSLAIASFTLQFIIEREKIALLRQIYGGLVEGGALFIAEKILASSAIFQELITFGYYDFKRGTFTPAEILEKERRLRGVMTPFTRAQLTNALRLAGFQARDIETFWQEGPFIGLVAIKRTSR